MSLPTYIVYVFWHVAGAWGKAVGLHAYCENCSNQRLPQFIVRVTVTSYHCFVVMVVVVAAVADYVPILMIVFIWIFQWNNSSSSDSVLIDTFNRFIWRRLSDGKDGKDKSISLNSLKDLKASDKVAQCTVLPPIAPLHSLKSWFRSYRCFSSVFIICSTCVAGEIIVAARATGGTPCTVILSLQLAFFSSNLNVSQSLLSQLDLPRAQRGKISPDSLRSWRSKWRRS